MPILLTGKLSMAETCQSLRGVIVTENLEADFRSFIDWLRVVLVRSSSNSLSPLLTSDPTASLAESILLNHHHSVLIHNLPGLKPSVSWATGSLIVTNIRYLVEQIEAEDIQKRNEDKGVDMFLGSTYGKLMNISWLFNLMVRVIPLWIALAWAP